MPEYINLTPHSIHVYHPSTPDRIEPDGEHQPAHVLAPSGAIARLDTHEIDYFSPCQEGAFLISYVNYSGAVGLPRFDAEAWGAADEPPGPYYVVSLVVVLAARWRPDLLSPYREVRNMSGQVIGCRAFARPV